MNIRRLLALLIPLMVTSLVVGCANSKSSEREETTNDDSITERMAEEHEDDDSRPSPAAKKEPESPVETRNVQYASVDGNDIEGYLATPEGASEDTPGIIVIHEWWGLNDNIRSMTRQLASQGYAALAVDLYRGESADTPDNAKSLMQEAMNRPDAAKQNLRQAHSYLESEVGAPKVGVIGWCFGGGWSLRTALMLPTQIDAAAIYYGDPITDRSELEKLEMPIIGFFGEDDQGIPVEKVRTFKETLEELDKDASIHIYEGAGHAFANPSGNNYDEQAAEDAWEKTIDFFNEHLATDGG